MAKMKAGEMSAKMKNKGVVEVASTNEMINEIKEVEASESLIEAIANEIDNEVKSSNIEDERVDIVDEKPAKNIDSNYKSSAKISPAFAKKLAKEEDKPRKKKTMIYLDGHAMDQFKTLSRQTGYSITKLFEMACSDYIKGQEVDEALVAEYDEVNGGKGKRKSGK